jgi:hypothetical protein
MRHFLKREKIVWQILKFAERLSNFVSTAGEKKFIDRCKGQSRFHFRMLVILIKLKKCTFNAIWKSFVKLYRIHNICEYKVCNRD